MRPEEISLVYQTVAMASEEARSMTFIESTCSVSVYSQSSQLLVIGFVLTGMAWLTFSCIHKTLQYKGQLLRWIASTLLAAVAISGASLAAVSAFQLKDCELIETNLWNDKVKQNEVEDFQ